MTQRKKERVLIFDTTLRDGEQCPGASMSHAEKLRVAKELELLRVDIVEAGFPAASQGDFKAVSAIAKKSSYCRIAGLARMVEADIRACGDAVRPAKKKRIHTFIATSSMHMQHKLRMTEPQVLARISRMVRLAKSLCSDVEFSPEDASRSRRPFLYKALRAAVEAGATTLNIPDTVGYADPTSFASLIAGIKKNVVKDKNITISTHCHDDLGQAVANALAGVEAGARQVECTINGIGERAGNSALEEVVMALHTQKGRFMGLSTGIHTARLMAASELIKNITGFAVPPNKAIVGENAFAHESGIHQDGILKKRETYEIMTPESVGQKSTRLALGKHSGRAAVAHHLAQKGHSLAPKELEKIMVAFKKMADGKKQITEKEILMLVKKMKK